MLDRLSGEAGVCRIKGESLRVGQRPSSASYRTSRSAGGYSLEKSQDGVRVQVNIPPAPTANQGVVRPNIHCVLFRRLL